MTTRLRLNPITCKAHGLCAELLPERITLDEWGYPIIDDNAVSSDLIDHARRAASACPTLALLLETDTEPDLEARFSPERLRAP